MKKGIFIIMVTMLAARCYCAAKNKGQYTGLYDNPKQ